MMRIWFSKSKIIFSLHFNGNKDNNNVQENYQFLEISLCIDIRMPDISLLYCRNVQRKNRFNSKGRDSFCYTSINAICVPCFIVFSSRIRDKCNILVKHIHFITTANAFYIVTILKTFVYDLYKAIYLFSHTSIVQNGT